MVTFTSRARLIKPAETGEVVDVSQINANMDKIDENLGTYVCTSTTRPPVPFPGQVIYETDTQRMVLRNATNTAWEMAVNCGYAYSFAPGFTGNITASSTAITQIHRIYLGPAGPTQPDLIISGTFQMQFSPANGNANTVNGFVLVSDDESNTTSGDTVIATTAVRTDSSANWYTSINFNYLLRGDSSNRYLKLGARRNNVATTWFNGAGLSYSLAVQPINNSNALGTVVPGGDVKV